MKWAQAPDEDYAFLVWEVAGPIGSCSALEFPEKDLISQRFAWKAIERSKGVTLQMRCNLVSLLFADVEYAEAGLHGKEWAVVRDKKAQLWLETWRCLDSAIIKNYDLNPQMAVAPAVPETMQRDFINKRRSGSNEKVSATSGNTKEFTEQYGLSLFAPSFKLRAEKYIIAAYSRPPLYIEGLRKHLNRCIKNAATNKRIIETILGSTKR